MRQASAWLIEKVVELRHAAASDIPRVAQPAAQSSQERDGNRTTPERVNHSERPNRVVSRDGGEVEKLQVPMSSLAAGIASPSLSNTAGENLRSVRLPVMSRNTLHLPPWCRTVRPRHPHELEQVPPTRKRTRRREDVETVPIHSPKMVKQTEGEVVVYINLRPSLARVIKRMSPLRVVDCASAVTRASKVALRWCAQPCQSGSWRW